MSQPLKVQKLGYLLKMAQHALRREMDEALRPLDLSISRYAVIAELARTPGLSNADLARKAFITPQSMQGVLSNLEKAGLILRSSDENHGRRQPSQLTKEGQNLLKKADVIAKKVEEKFTRAIAPLSEEQVSALFVRICTEFS
jgi:DNA-binding MarR family transcriptional regulator